MRIGCPGSALSQGQVSRTSRARIRYPTDQLKRTEAAIEDNAQRITLEDVHSTALARSPSKRGALETTPPTMLMHDVFLSHSGTDTAAVEAIAARLRDEVKLRPFLDRWHLIPGTQWIAAIEQAIWASKTVAVFFGPSRKSTWRDQERQLALIQSADKHNKRIIPVLLPGGQKSDIEGLLSLRTWVDLADRDGFARLVAGITGRTPEPLAPSILCATKLEAAYERREQLTIAGQDTTAIDSEILKLRRKQRRGSTLKAGEFLHNGRFRLANAVGSGGFATVWKAYDRKEKRVVAVKVLHGQFEQDASRRERLFRGARRMAALQHPNIVRVLIPEGEDQGFYYYVMEYFPGGDLYKAITERRINFNESLSIIESISSALEVAHNAGLVHRDVKPQNILLRSDRSPALSDFDLVQAQDTTGGTRTGAMGTVIYSAPEQNEDASTVDHRADIYSLGMTTVFCLHGRKLPNTAMFGRERFLASLWGSPAVRSVLYRAVALQPSRRFETIADFRREFISARAKPSRTSTPGKQTDTKSTPAPSQTASSPRTQSRASLDHKVVRYEAEEIHAVRASSTRSPKAGSTSSRRRWPIYLGAGALTVIFGLLGQDLVPAGALSGGFPNPFLTAFEETDEEAQRERLDELRIEHLGKLKKTRITNIDRLLRAGRLAEAKILLDPLLDEDPKNARLSWRRGKLFAARPKHSQNMESALNAYGIALNTAPLLLDDREFQENLKALLYKYKSNHEAVDFTIKKTGLLASTILLKMVNDSETPMEYGPRHQALSEIQDSSRDSAKVDWSLQSTLDVLQGAPTETPCTDYREALDFIVATPRYWQLQKLEDLPIPSAQQPEKGAKSRKADAIECRRIKALRSRAIAQLQALQPAGIGDEAE